MRSGRRCARRPAGGPGWRRASGANACGSIARSRLAVARPSICGRDGEIDPEASDDAIPCPFEQDAGELGVTSMQVVGPFELEVAARRGGIDRFDQRQPGGERERRRAADRLAAARIRVDPAKLPSRDCHSRPCRPFPDDLPQRDQPVALNRVRIGEQVGIGRASLLDECGFGSKQRRGGLVGERADRADRRDSRAG